MWSVHGTSGCGHWGWSLGVVSKRRDQSRQSRHNIYIYILIEQNKKILPTHTNIISYLLLEYN